MKTHSVGGWLMAGSLVIAPLVLRAAEPGGQAGAPSAATSTAADSQGTNAMKAATAADKAPVSAGVAEILKMVDAGVSKDVVKAYVESSAIDYDPTAADLIALKEHGVADDIATALVKRGAEVRAQASQANTSAATAQISPGAVGPNAAAPAYADSNAGSGYLDPESHDFWWYYYAYPRTLAYANQRMFSYNPAFAYSPPSFYGYYQPMPFRPYSPAVFNRARFSGVRGSFAPLNRNGVFQPAPGLGGQQFGQPR